jgi:hypothetical protein
LEEGIRINRAFLKGTYGTHALAADRSFLHTFVGEHDYGRDDSRTDQYLAAAYILLSRDALASGEFSAAPSYAEKVSGLD